MISNPVFHYQLPNVQLETNRHTNKQHTKEATQVYDKSFYSYVVRIVSIFEKKKPLYRSNMYYYGFIKEDKR